ncbi:hypothetical protein HHK36_016964 [Tetracentron sinense]|uniref:Chlororespiratory reduction 42 n=1 Tax=Tetracentron sinense TaxID=13715 RepID=A0A835DC14_TETSI|nr:hypothetical protein HHK36_016964 [Tetracentron sinense]
MALSFSTAIIPSSKLQNTSTRHLNYFVKTQIRNPKVVTRCESTESSARNSRLEIGSPIVVVEAPASVKTAASVPCLMVNTGLIKPGDVGRIVARKPKDVWAVRLNIGTYLIDGKYFRPLDLDK